MVGPGGFDPPTSAVKGANVVFPVLSFSCFSMRLLRHLVEVIFVYYPVFLTSIDTRTAFNGLI
jgi:hypothetical protein